MKFYFYLYISECLCGCISYVHRCPKWSAENVGSEKDSLHRWACFQSSDQSQTTFKYLFSQRDPLLSKEEMLQWPARVMLVKLKLARVPSGSPQVEVTGGWELPNMGAGSQIWIIQKCSMQDQLLSHHSNCSPPCFLQST